MIHCQEPGSTRHICNLGRNKEGTSAGSPAVHSSFRRLPAGWEGESLCIEATKFVVLHDHTLESQSTTMDPQWVGECLIAFQCSHPCQKMGSLNTSAFWLTVEGGLCFALL